MALNEILPKALRLFADQEAVVCGATRLTYREFGERVFRLCHGLDQIGLGGGDRLAVLHENCHRFLELYLAAAHMGLILVPLNYRLSPKELHAILQDSQSRVAVVQEKFLGKLDPLAIPGDLLEQVVVTRAEGGSSGEGWWIYDDLIRDQPDRPVPSPAISGTDVAQLYYTSGTTGRPKGVMLTHNNVQTHALGTMAELRLSDADHWIHVAPLFHLADAWATFAMTWAGGKHIVVPTFDPVTVFRAIEQEQVTLTNLIPTMLNMMVNHPEVDRFDYSSLRVLLSGGAPIAPELVRKIMETFKTDYVQTYGMTETSPYLTLSILKHHLTELPPGEQLRIKASTGREFVTVSLRVVDEVGADVVRNGEQVGEIVVKGDSVTPGYWNLPEETAKVFRDGWLYTGDLAVIDSEGYVTIVDRKKDMIVTGGENVFSTEVENVLYQHPDILEVAVIGVPDPHWGEAVKACVVMKEGRRATEQEIIRFCKEQLASYKAPKSIEFLAELPRTGSGKIFKKGLRPVPGEGGSPQS